MSKLKTMKKMNRFNILKMSNITGNVWISVWVLCLFGLMMIYSASSVTCQMENQDDMFLLKKQMMYMALGLFVMLIGQFYDYKKIEKRAVGVYVFGLFTVGVLLTGLGISSNGATRWINLKFATVQPAEIVKVTTIIMLAYMASHYSTYLSKWQLTIRMWIVGGIPAVLLYVISNDLSSGLVVLGITFICTLISNNTMKLHACTFAVLAGLAGSYVYHISQNMPSAEELEKSSFRVGRIAAWLDPEKYASSQGYQILQAKYAIGSGGFFGKGLGGSVQKISNIPEAQNDMIFAIICEELGIFGAVALLVLIGFLMHQLVKIALHSESLFGGMIVSGVVAHIGLQTIINVAVASNAFPNTGLALPFISYGGSSIVCLLMEIMLCLSVNLRSEIRKTSQNTHGN